MYSKVTQTNTTTATTANLEKTNNDFEEILNKFYNSGKEYIEYEEFLRATLNIEDVITEKNLKMAFDYFDQDNSGTISHENLKHVLGISFDDINKEKEVIKEIFENAQLSLEKELNFDVFKDFMNKMLIKKQNL